MPVHHYTFHAYRSWNADHPEGWIQRGKLGVQEPDRGIARYRARIARFPAVRFSDWQQHLIVSSAREICTRHGWQCRGVGADETHVHVVVSWAGEEAGNAEFRKKLKRVIGLLLARDAGTTGIPYFPAGYGDTRVRDREHFDYLISTYLPSHRVWWG